MEEKAAKEEEKSFLTRISLREALHWALAPELIAES